MTIAEKTWQEVSFNSDISGPLDGLVVIDISRLVAGNMASMQKAAERLFDVIGRSDMNQDSRYQTNEERVKRRHEVDEIVGGWIKEHDAKEVLDHFVKEGITAGPMYNIEDICSDPHFIERGIYVDLPDEELGKAAMHNVVPRLSRHEASFRLPAPKLGQHTGKLLRWAGFNDDQIEHFYQHQTVSGERS